jgi:hypothetical protein
MSLSEMETPCFLADFTDHEAMNHGERNNSQAELPHVIAQTSASVPFKEVETCERLSRRESGVLSRKVWIK